MDPHGRRRRGASIARASRAARRALDLEIAEHKARPRLEDLPVRPVLEAGLNGPGGGIVGEHADVREFLQALDSGGVIAVGRDGRIAMPFNSEGMLRGAMDSRGLFQTGLLRE